MMCRSGLIPPALLAAVLGAALTGPAAAQPPNLELTFSDDAAGEVGRVNELRLRPNVRRPVFLHLKNTGGPATVRVEVVGGGRVLASTPPFAAKGAAPIPVIFGKPEVPKNKDGKPEAPKDAKPAPLPKVPGPVHIRVVADGPKGEVLKETPLVRVLRPSEYVTVDSITFDPTARADGKKNVLEVRLIPGANFSGTPARVDLVLRPDRIPALVPSPRRQGAYSGLLAAGGALVLRAENLQLRDETALPPGLIYLTIDGYERAYTYRSRFGGEKTKLEPGGLSDTLVRLSHPPFAKPGDKLKVTVEADNVPADATGDLALYRELDQGKLPTAPEKREGIASRFRGDRQVQMFFAANADPDGALVFEPKASDWSFGLDTEGVFGDRYLGLRVLGTKEENKKKVEFPLEFVDTLASLRGPQLARVTQITSRVLLSDTPPEAIALDVDLPAKAGEVPQLPIGSQLPLKATAQDPTGIRKAVFFVGKAPADGKFPPTQPHAEGERVPGPDEVWTALLDAPTAKAATLAVSVQMTNGVGVTQTKTIQIQLVDPSGKGAEKKLATITGKVVEGSRAIAGVPVTLVEDKEKGGVKGATTTNAKGEFKFENVPPGGYMITAVRSASRTRGQTIVAVPEGKEKIENADVKLTR